QTLICNFWKGAMMTTHRFCGAAVGVLLLAMMATEPCAAQNVLAPQILDPKACSDEQRLLPNGAAPQLPGPPNQTLSEKLDHTEGVICPPLGVAPELPLPPPGGGKRSAIPRPGRPGADPTVGRN